MKYLKQCFDWNNNKINRKEWWYSLLVLIFAYICIMFLSILLAGLIGIGLVFIVGLILIIIYYYSFVNISRKRLKDIGLNSNLCYIILIPTGDIALLILCGLVNPNLPHDASHKKLAKKILLFPVISSLFLIILWAITAFVSGMISVGVEDFIVRVIPFLLGLSIMMIFPCLVVFLALRYN